MKIFKTVILIIIIILVSIRLSLVDSEREEHLLQCKETYKINVKTTFSWYEATSCKHIN